MQRFIQIIAESTETHIENFNRIEKLIDDELQNSGSTRLTPIRDKPHRKLLIKLMMCLFNPTKSYF